MIKYKTLKYIAEKRVAQLAKEGQQSSADDLGSGLIDYGLTRC